MYFALSVRKGAIEASRRTGTALRMILEKIVPDAAGHANFFCFGSCRVSRVIETHQCSLDVRRFISSCHMFLTEYLTYIIYIYISLLHYSAHKYFKYPLILRCFCTVRLYKVPRNLRRLGSAWPDLCGARCGAHRRIFAFRRVRAGSWLFARYHETCVPQSGEAPSAKNDSKHRTPRTQRNFCSDS